MDNVIRLSLLLLVFGQVTGCGLLGVRRIDVSVDSICGEEPSQKKRYILVSGDGEEEGLLFKEYAVYVNRALLRQGFQLADPPENAEIVIYLSYGVGEARSNFYSKTTSSPDYVWGGKKLDTKSGTYMTYPRYMLLEARDLGDDGVELWRTTASSVGSSSDLRRIFPVLVAASVPYIGGNTGSYRTVRLHENHKKVVAIRDGI